MKRAVVGAFLVWCAVCACRSLAPPPVPTPPSPPRDAAPERLTAGSSRATASGATFTAPAGWTIQSRGQAWILDGPEANLRVGVVDVQAADADVAVASAWPVVHPGFARPIKLAQSYPGRRGWDELRSYDYEISPDERLVVFADAHRKGGRWIVLLVEAGEGPFQRWVAQVRLVAQSVRPGGYTRESFKGRTAHALDAERIARITDFVERGRAQLQIPGVAVALIQDGKPVFEGGFGVRALGKPARVGADTLFMIASDTKALTTLLLAKLVDEGKLSWDTPVTIVYPTFALGNEETTRQVLVRHLVCACTGMPRQDLEWLLESGRATPSTVMERLARSQPTTRFGQVYQYSNALAAAAGYIGAHALLPERELGAAYDEAMRRLVFGPLGMTRTTFDFTQALRDDDHATPHGEDIDGKMAPALMEGNYWIRPMRPAGGAWSSVRELSRYVEMELARGALPDGARYVSEASLLARRAPQVAIGEDRTYGMGLVVDAHFGIPVVSHNGSLMGYMSNMFWLPDHGVGGVILTNADTGGVLAAAFVRKTLEVLFDGNDEAEQDVTTSARNLQAEIAKVRERLVLPADPAVVSKLASRYTSPALGEVAVRRDGAETVFDFGEWKSTMAVRRNDDRTVSLVTVVPGMYRLAFIVADREGKRRLVLRDAQHEYEFNEVQGAPAP